MPEPISDAATDVIDTLDAVLTCLQKQLRQSQFRLRESAGRSASDDSNPKVNQNLVRSISMHLASLVRIAIKDYPEPWSDEAVRREVSKVLASVWRDVAEQNRMEESEDARTNAYCGRI